ncbi:aminotransferase class V-fold PLP-dependent enzyme [Aliidiomarina maris]|uniref:Selenocysteine lyase n=1 Tax=Aliidiomarina maris TaxID=531312 RepID=A0A327WZP2_9GAMM|nr:aminotransferase class V-fold PLP-dependent enzyme [Aliidiomarina maris]MBA3989338.1 selenocysteine lyase [Idiomarina sp.]MCL5255610.1 aminotransferase class V-fold PLP-dependent enzyme [Gammaproteobacteria bacterium]RAJ99200.1 selenocysteine lyase/cysteine desulfurase [Aliidiomarina maris]RUO27655.1 selenocysteine lyase [Aliidiomarina maris]
MRHLYSRFLDARPGVLHMSPHSHYYWPDVTRQAQLDYWDDAARFADDKWDEIFARRVPAVQAMIAERLHVSSPEQIAFAGNTHEFVYRIMSSFAADKPLRILTTDSEFHSFSRQSRRLLERGNVEITTVPAQPYASLATRWRDAVAAQTYELIFISQIFYNSGVAAPGVDQWLDAVRDDNTVVVVDGYHGFGAVPTDWSAFQHRVFYLAGGYKYAQAGEGVCFAVVPQGCKLRPEYTGWFADFANLAKPQQGAVEYADDGMRMAGATMDFSALYRLQAVLQMWQQEGLSDTKVNAYVRDLQQGFLRHIDSLNHPLLTRANLLVEDYATHGHFFTFQLSSPEEVQSLATRLREQGVMTDYRYDRLRFGFALYQQVQEFEQIVG